MLVKAWPWGIKAEGYYVAVTIYKIHLRAYFLTQTPIRYGMRPPVEAAVSEYSRLALEAGLTPTEMAIR